MATMTESSLSNAVQQVDMTHFLQTGNCSGDCRSVAHSLRTSGAVLVRDPRVKASDAASFIDMMERYFSQSRETKLKDARPHLFYQVRSSRLQFVICSSYSLPRLALVFQLTPPM